MPGQNVDPPSPAIADGQFIATAWLDNLQERLTVGDTEKYGLRGGGEYKFHAAGYIPEKYLKGLLLESWEVSLEKLVFHVRPGIYWAPNEEQSAWMEARELTAEDVAADIIRFVESPWGGRFEGFITTESVKVIDRYTLEIEFVEYTPSVLYYIGFEDRAIISPPETEAAGADKWKNQVGTGAFMFEDYVIGSYMSFVRNPNYWDTTTINGVEYQMPFIDRVVRPIIPDAATRMAALKTGIIDFQTLVVTAQWDMLDGVAPQLQYSRTEGTSASHSLVFRVDEPPFDDVRVRQAMVIGTNINEFMLLGGAPKNTMLWLPIHPGNPAYIPLEELPADIRILYEYDPTLAKQLLAEALGPPDANGVFFKTNLLIDSTPAYLDSAALLKYQWAKIGVEVSIDAHENTEYARLRYPHPEPLYKGALLDGMPGANPVMVLLAYLTDSGMNFAEYSNPEFDAIASKLPLAFDADEQIRLLKEANLVFMRDATVTGLFFSTGRNYWWPWLKNYYGEFTIQDGGASLAALFPYLWIDQVMKEDMGY